MNAETAERIAMALESIAKDGKRFVDAADRNEAEAKRDAPDDKRKPRRLFVGQGEYFPDGTALTGWVFAYEDRRSESDIEFIEVSR